MELFNSFLLFYCSCAVIFFLIFYVKDLIDKKKLNKLDVIFNLIKSLPIGEAADKRIDELMVRRMKGAKYRKIGE